MKPLVIQPQTQQVAPIIAKLAESNKPPPQFFTNTDASSQALNRQFERMNVDRNSGRNDGRHGGRLRLGKIAE